MSRDDGRATHDKSAVCTMCEVDVPTICDACTIEAHHASDVWQRLDGLAEKLAAVCEASLDERPAFPSAPQLGAWLREYAQDAVTYSEGQAITLTDAADLLDGAALKARAAKTSGGNGEQVASLNALPSLPTTPAGVPEEAGTNLRTSEAQPRCTVCGASRIVDENGRAGACSLVPGRDGRGGCPDPLHDVRASSEGPTRPPLTHVAIRFQGKVWSLPRPYRHHHIMGMIRHLDPSVDRVDAHGDDQGFLDASGRYLRRPPALVSARLNGQLKNEKIIGGVLTSEDLW